MKLLVICVLFGLVAASCGRLVKDEEMKYTYEQWQEEHDRRTSAGHCGSTDYCYGASASCPTEERTPDLDVKYRTCRPNTGIKCDEEVDAPKVEEKPQSTPTGRSVFRIIFDFIVALIEAFITAIVLTIVIALAMLSLIVSPPGILIIVLVLLGTIVTSGVATLGALGGMMIEIGTQLVHNFQQQRQTPTVGTPPVNNHHQSPVAIAPPKVCEAPPPTPNEEEEEETTNSLPHLEETAEERLARLQSLIDGWSRTHEN